MSIKYLYDCLSYIQTSKLEQLLCFLHSYCLVPYMSVQTNLTLNCQHLHFIAEGLLWLQDSTPATCAVSQKCQGTAPLGVALGESVDKHSPCGKMAPSFP